jgi:hypothetical protein
LPAVAVHLIFALEFSDGDSIPARSSLANASGSRLSGLPNAVVRRSFAALWSQVSDKTAVRRSAAVVDRMGQIYLPVGDK